MDNKESLAKGVFGRDYFEIEPDRCALVIIDMQNGFLEDGAPYETQNGRAIVPNLNRLVAAARKHDIPVIWTYTNHSAPMGGLIRERHPLIKYGNALCQGDHSFELYKGPSKPGSNEPAMVQPEADELIVVKNKFDAFYGTNLDLMLRNLKKDTVIITGVATEVCCESTARSAYFHDYKVVFMRDITAAFLPGHQEATCEILDVLFARVMSTDEVLAALEAGRG